MDLHPNVATLAPLIGVWRGAGQGEYPTITSFAYTDEWTFSHTGKPFVAFVQRTRSTSGAPMHTESGYLRGTGEGALEIVAALPTGQVEIGAGHAQTRDSVLVISTDAEVHATPSAKRVDRIVRTFRVDGDTLTIELAMSAVNQPVTHHLASQLSRERMVE